MKRHFSFLLLLLFAVQMHAQATIHYVIPGGTGGGTSWQDGGDLAQMLTQAQDGDEVWVLQGAYYPSPVEIYHSISVYGGFTDTSTHPNWRPSLLQDRSWIIFDNLNNPNNVPFISVNFDPNATNPQPTLDHFVLDGFIMRDAFTSYSNNYGGALRADSIRNLYLRNLYVYNCQAYNGGGMYLNNILYGYMENVFFNNNYAVNYGGGLFLSFCTDFIMVNTAFTHNQADCISSPVPSNMPETFGSGGMFIESSNVIIYNLTATQNGTNTFDYQAKRHAYKAGCITGSDVAFYNSIIYPDTMNIEYNHQNTVSFNQCCLWTTTTLYLHGRVYTNNCNWDTYNTITKSGVSSLNPMFDFSTHPPFPYLNANSPYIDAGSNPYSTSYDLFGLPRVVGSNVDYGALEFQ
ncbi:MAG: hypothetical protein J6S82_08665 [Bacteroidales bacterium]|nr:hypothetical protein [Bacteroidales bacterium]